MCHLSMKLSDQLIKILLIVLTKLGKTHSDEKCSHGLTMRAKVKVTAKIKSQCPREQNICLPKNIEQGFPVIGVTLMPTLTPKQALVKQICPPPPYGRSIIQKRFLKIQVAKPEILTFRQVKDLPKCFESEF